MSDGNLSFLSFVVSLFVKDDGDFNSRKPRRSFEERGDFRSGKRFDKEGDGNDRRD
jgi:hypothetical protein